MIQKPPPAAGAIPARQGFSAAFLRLLRNSPVPVFCAAMLGVIAILFAFGMVRLHTNPIVFRTWIAEDGLVEWLTFAGLVALALYAFAQAREFGSHIVTAEPDPGRRGRVTWIALGLVCLFGAIEEISWGQRIIGWESPEWFLRHNAQEETNLHNLVVAGVKVNRVVFGKGLGLALVIYLLVLPPLYRRWQKLRTFIDQCAVPVAQNYQIALALTVAALTRAVVKTEGKVGEIHELALVFVFLAVVMHPYNGAVIPGLPWLRRAGVRAADVVRATVPVFARFVSARVRFMAAVAAFLVTVFMLFRLGFAAAFEPPGLVGPVGDLVSTRGIPRLLNASPGLVPAGDLAWAWWLGFKYDLRTALLLLLPVALLSWLKPFDLVRRHHGWLGYLAAAGAAAFVLHAVDLGHYAYEATRLDATLLDHIMESGIAAGMVWETYPVLRVLAALLALLAFYVWALRRWMPVAADALPSGANERHARRAVAALVTMLYVFGIYGTWSWYPLRWSDAYFSTSNYLSALALNPVQNLYDTFHVRSAGFDAAAVQRAYPLVAAQLGVDKPDPVSLSLARQVQPPPSPLGQPNVVVVLLESFSAYKTGVLGNPLDPTPHFDALAHNSVLFSRFYAAARPTARAVFSALFGIADVNPVESASRNPLASRQHTLVNAFEGYEKFYFIGGSASWGNIRAMLARNIPGLHLYEEGSYAASRGDTWGVSDLHLLEEVHGVLKGQTRPFIAFIQTSGNHRPYTIPADNRGFERKPMEPAALRRAGFDAEDAYDGIRFMDHALGHYFRLARTAPYYGRTVFLLFGDHGSPAERFPDIENELRRLHVPLVIHSPALFPGGGRVITEVASSIDVLPTAAALAGLPYRNTAMGSDLLGPRAAGSPLAFMAAGRFMGLLDGDFFLSINATGRQSLYRHRADGALEPGDLSTSEPEQTARMSELCHALRDTSHWLLYNNKS